MIKIRMWSNNANKYFYNKDSFECLVQQIRFNEGEPFLGIPFDHVKDGMSFEQYTGLKDKTGKEIYEGDIIAGVFVWGAVGGEVFFDESVGAFGIKNDMLFDAHDLKNFEIKGNIHEDPELLT